MSERYDERLLRDAIRLEIVAIRERYLELCVAGPNIARDEAEAVKAMRPVRSAMARAVAGALSLIHI